MFQRLIQVADETGLALLGLGRPGLPRVERVIEQPPRRFADLQPLRGNLALGDDNRTSILVQEMLMGTPDFRQLHERDIVARNKRFLSTEAFLEDIKEAKLFDRPVVTTLEPLKEFFPAESYHQNYVCANPTQPYVRSVALPKVQKVRQKFRDRLKPTSPLGR